MTSKRRVVVTGMGMLSPLGTTVVDSWDGIRNGRSGISRIESFDTSSFNVHFGGAVKGLDVSQYLSVKDSKKMDLFIQYGIIAGMQAVADSGLQITEQNAERVGCAIGAGIGGLPLIEKTHQAYLEAGPRKISPFFVPASIINMIAGNLSILYGCRGPNIAVTTACTTGVHNVGLAARMIAYGDADVMIAGGAEMATSPMGLGGFAAARTLSTRNEAPTEASRPWDRDRDGFVLGDGAGVLVLEELEHARARGAKVYAELIGFGMSGDAYHMTSPTKDGSGAALAMSNALKDAGLNLDQIDYINAHGTSTKAGDLAETMAIKRVFGQHAYQLMVSSTKSMTGHLLGAAGSVEAIFSVLSICDALIPPTINLQHADEGCDLDYVPGAARDYPVRHVLCNSFGFGGTNGSLVFRKFD